MTVITITGDLGSTGSIATQVAAALGYALADRELLQEAAHALAWTEDEVATFDERTAGQGGRMASFLRDFAARTSFTDLDAAGFGILAASTYADAAAAEMRPRDLQYFDVLAALIRDLANRGNVVIVGRGAQLLLAGRDDALHVRIVCDRGERIRRIAARDGMTVRDALARIEDSDQQRAAWHKKYFEVDYQSPYLYHATLNSGWLSDEVAAGVILQLAWTVEHAGEGQAHDEATARGRQDWGWLQIVDRATGDVLARGHLFATKVAPAQEWRGELESVRLSPGVPSLRSGAYFARFALSGTDHIVEVDAGGPGIQVAGRDAQIPAIFLERAGG